MTMTKQEEHELIESMQVEIEILKAKNAALSSKRTGKLTLRVSPKGCVSIYGINSMGLHLYKEQLLKVLDAEKELRQFIVDHDAALPSKA